MPFSELRAGAYTALDPLRDAEACGYQLVRAGVTEKRRGRWIQFTFSDPADLAPVTACYVVLVDGGAHYIGQTRDLRARFKSHGIFLIGHSKDRANLWRTPWGYFQEDRVQFRRRVSSRYGDWLMHEARLIRRLQPSANRV